MNKTLKGLVAELTPAWLTGVPAVDPNNVPQPPMPAPTWTPEIDEPEPDTLPDEKREPNPDENREPPKHAAANSNTPLSVGSGAVI